MAAAPARIEARLWGDPFGSGEASVALRRLLRLASAHGVRCGLCLSCLRGAGGEGRREIRLDDGVAEFPIRTDLADDELEPVLRAARREVFATAALVVFAADLTEAALEFPEAALTIPWHPNERVMLARVLRQRDLPGTERPGDLDGAELAPWLELPPPPGRGVVLHPASTDPARGTDVALAAVAGLSGVRLLLVPEAETGPPPPAWAGEHVAVDPGPLHPELVSGADAVLLPVREAPGRRELALLAASGRPLLISRFAATAHLTGRAGTCRPIGGRLLAERFEPDVRAVRAALQDVAAKRPAMAAIGRRGRAHVLARARLGAPRAAPRFECFGRRPLVVLEAPVLETSSTSVLTMATARALGRRGRVEVVVVPTPPFRRAPVDLPFEDRRWLGRPPSRADLWLAAGWPPRPARPPARCFAQRIDWEYGALPVQLTPSVTEEADAVVVHSEAVRRLVVAAGRSPDDVVLAPHGVDAAVFSPQAPPLARVAEFTGERFAFLFVGGPIWRKGFDLVLRLACGVFGANDPVCLVVKPVGIRDVYRNHHLLDLARRVAGHPGAMDVLVLDEDLDPRQMAGLYTACDALVHPYRGEGFGLPVLEARACGLPVIITAGGSTDDFCNGESCLTVRSQRRIVELPEPCVSRPWVLEPDVEHFGTRVRQAVEERTELVVAARREARELVRARTWDAAAARIEELAFRSLGAAVAV